MYQVGRKDKLVEMPGIPQCEPGSPCPHVFTDEFSTKLVYMVAMGPIEWDGESPFPKSKIATIQFFGVTSVLFGPPNDEALNGHPLFSRGLSAYTAFQVTDSSWVKVYRDMNAVHPRHNKAMYKDKNHYIFVFHDSTFECIADEIEFSVDRGTIGETLAGFADDIKE